MKEPDVVGECVAAMQKAVKIPVHIKTRLGVDDFDTYDFALDFVKKTHEISKCQHYIMHARKAYLKVKKKNWGDQGIFFYCLRIERFCRF